MTNKDPMQITERELHTMTVELEEMHQATLPVFRESLNDFGATLRRRTAEIGAHAASRRTFLMGSGVVIGGMALAACGSNDDPGVSAPTGGATTGSGGGADTAALSTNASLEALAVFAYGAALEGAGKGMFGKVPPVVAGFAKHAMAQHKDHMDAFNAALTKSGAKPFTMPDPALAKTVTDAFGKLTDVPGLAKLALSLESTAAATYVKQMGELTDAEAIAAVATIAPVEQQHAAILSFVLGIYPAPDTFVKLDLARPNTDAGVS